MVVDINRIGNPLFHTKHSPFITYKIVILEKPVDIRKNFKKSKPFVLTAKEIVLLSKGE